MSSTTALKQAFCQDLIKNNLFDEAVNLVKESLKLEVKSNQSKQEFKITANGVEILDLVETLLESWLKNKKRKQRNGINEKVKAGKENPVLDIDVSNGHVMWVFWGNLYDTLLSAETYANVKTLKTSSVDLKPDNNGKTFCITCNFKDFVDVKKKVEKMLQSQDGSNKSQKTNTKNPSKADSSQSKGSIERKDEKIKEKDTKSCSQSETKVETFKMTSGQAGSDKAKSSDQTNSSHLDDSQSKVNKDSKGSGTGETDDKSHSESTTNKQTYVQHVLNPNQSNQSEGVENPNSNPNQSPESSSSEDEKRKDDNLLFVTPACRIKVFVYKASIINLSDIDAIVNAANDHLNHAGGVAYHISKAAGGDKSSLEIECRNYIKKHDKLDVTKNFTSSAGKMPYKGVIHAVGPMWSDYKVKEECAEALCMTIVNVLEEADKKKFLKIALPAISSGIYGVPKTVCADMYIKGVMDYVSRVPQTSVKEIHFVDISEDILKEIKDAYERWKPNGLPGQPAKTVHFKDVQSGNLAPSFRLSKSTCVRVYVCSIVEVKEVDAIACEVGTDFSIERRAIAQVIKKAGGSNYEEEFNKMAKDMSGSKGDVFICKTGGPLKSKNIRHVIHIKCKTFENIQDMERLKNLFDQVFQCAMKEKLKTIVMPVIGAASLKQASKDDTFKCSLRFAKSLKEAFESTGKDTTVKEIHFVDLDPKLISSICKAFQELNTANMDDTKSKGEQKNEPVSRSKSDEPQDNTPKSKPDEGDGWIKVENGSDNCSYEKCTRKGANKCAQCGHFICDVCTVKPLSRCPFCKNT